MMTYGVNVQNRASMDQELYNLHLEAGRRAGKDRTCGQKVAFPTEESATRAAERVNRRPVQHHKVEPYPCAFCQKWHTGRVMSEDELKTITA